MLTITPEQASAFILNRQFLVNKADDLPTVVRQLVCVQTQYAASLPGALWARVQNITAADVEAAMLQQRSLVKTWTVRGTLHTIATDDLPLLVPAIMHHRIGWHRHYVRKNLQLSDAEIDAYEAEIMAALAHGPLDRQAIHQQVAALQRMTSAGWGGDVKGLAYRGDLVFAEGRTFARRDWWLPDLPWHLHDEAAAQREVLRRYFYAHGPASVADFRHWVGMKVAWVRELVAANDDLLHAVNVEGWPDTCYVLKTDLKALQHADPAAVPPFLLLPKFDTLLLAWNDTMRFLDERHYKKIYRKAAQIEAVFLFNGRIAGVWRQKLTKTRYTLIAAPFRKLGKARQRTLQRTATQLAAFYDRPHAELQLVDEV